MRTFYEDCKGTAIAFWFYYWAETTPPGSVDLTGASTVGRYVAVFTSHWDEAVVLGRTAITLEIQEVA